MIWDVNPFKSVGPIVFGMEPADVRKGIGGEFRIIRRGLLPEEDEDYFEKLGIFAYYDNGGRLEALQFAGPIEPVIEERRMLGLPFDKVVGILIAKDRGLQIDRDGALSPSLGLSVWAPAAIDSPPSDPVEAVLVFGPRYYDKLMKAKLPAS
jgi:hypothetical protein